MGQTFNKDPGEDPEQLRRMYVDERRGCHFYFRHMNGRMQQRFAEIVDHDEIPTAFIHGNPHFDNYAKSDSGAAMVDFDRSRFGPYAYDIVRFLVSVMLRGKGEELSPVVADAFHSGYLQGALNPHQGFEQMAHLRAKSPKPWEQSTRAYVNSNRRWAGKLKSNETAPEESMTSLLGEYLSNRNELHLLERFMLLTSACVRGSFGKLHHLFLLVPKRGHDEDDILIDVKEVYDDPDTRWYYNPFPHNGQRMVAAGDLFAPEWERRPGWATHEGGEYWGRQISPHSVKLKKPLSKGKQQDICFAVASQLGRGHALSVLGMHSKDLADHFRMRFELFVQSAQTLRDELVEGHLDYLERSAALQS